MSDVMGLPQDAVERWLATGDTAFAEWCAMRVALADDSGASSYYTSLQARVLALQAVSVDLPAVDGFVAAGDQRIPAVHNAVVFRAQGQAGQLDKLHATNSAMDLTAVAAAAQEG